MQTFHKNNNSVSAYSKQCNICKSDITEQSITLTEFCRFDMYTHSIHLCSDKCYNKHKAGD